MSKYYKGDIGTEIILDTGVDLVALGATVTNIRVKKPNGNEVLWEAEIVELTKVKYTVILNDLDMAGEYRLNAYVELPTWKGRGDTVFFKVHEHFQ